MMGGWRGISLDGICPEDFCGMVQRGLEKFPDNQDLLALNAEILEALGVTAEQATATAVQFTQDALPTVTSIVSVTPTPPKIAPIQQDEDSMAQVTRSPSPTAVLTDTPAPQPLSPTASPTTPPDEGGGGLCSAGLLPLAGAFVLIGVSHRRRRRS
jgi:hypothetical protein